MLLMSRDNSAGNHSDLELIGLKKLYGAEHSF
jgi:hypothetical protein